MIFIPNVLVSRLFLFRAALKHFLYKLFNNQWHDSPKSVDLTSNVAIMYANFDNAQNEFGNDVNDWETRRLSVKLSGNIVLVLYHNKNMPDDKYSI